MHARRALLAVLVVGAMVLASCALDEAELHEAGASQIEADTGELRVLSYEDDPAAQAWVDAVPADPAVFLEVDEFREEGSRTAEPDEVAEHRRLFTAVAEGRTVLVQVDCDPCRGGADDPAAEILVWDLVVGDRRQALSPGTAIARPDEVFEADRSGFVVVVRDGASGTATTTVLGDDTDPGELRLVAQHEPDDGAALFVDVYVAVEPGAVTLVYDDDLGATRYPVLIV